MIKLYHGKEQFAWHALRHMECWVHLYRPRELELDCHSADDVLNGNFWELKEEDFAAM